MATGKYAGVIDKLPRLIGTEPAHQEKVNVVKQAILERAPRLSGWTASDLANEYRRVRANKEEIEKILSEASLVLEAVTELLVDQYEVEGTTSVRIATDNSTVTVQLEPWAQIQDPEKYRLWCIEHGFQNKMVLPWMTSNGIVKERLLAGLPEPEGVVATARPKIVLRKG